MKLSARLCDSSYTRRLNLFIGCSVCCADRATPANHDKPRRGNDGGGGQESKGQLFSLIYICLASLEIFSHIYFDLPLISINSWYDLHTRTAPCVDRGLISCWSRAQAGGGGQPAAAWHDGRAHTELWRDIPAASPGHTTPPTSTASRWSHDQQIIIGSCKCAASLHIYALIILASISWSHVYILLERSIFQQ